MKILGISGSTRKNEISGTYKLVKETLEATSCDHELVSLRGKKIGGCIACLACAEDNICKVHDDMEPLREKIVEADAYVIGAPNFYSRTNALTHAFMERLFQFRHCEGDVLWGKLAVAVGVGAISGQFCCDQIEQFMTHNLIETVAKVCGTGAASCYYCGYGETCKIGMVMMVHGEGFKITPETIPDVAKDTIAIESAHRAGQLLGRRLKNGHNRIQVTQRMLKLAKKINNPT